MTTFDTWLLAQQEKGFNVETCLVCSENYHSNGLIMCDECNAVQEFGATDEGDLIHACGRTGVWEDCDLHENCYAITCGKCGVYERDCKEQGTCDTCGATYATHSREGRCGNCGNCADHCDHQDSNETGNCDCCFEVKPLKRYKHEGDFFYWCATCVENEDYLRLYDND